MFKNEKKGRLYGIKKDTTFVENPPLEDNTTKVIRSINFSKSNFASLGKWILIIVLFLYFGSYTINGFIASNITKNSTEETVVHEYKKQIGSELVGGNFDDFTYDNIKILMPNKKIYLKKTVPNIDFVNIGVSNANLSSSFSLSLPIEDIKFYDEDDNLLYRDRYGSFLNITYYFNISIGLNYFNYIYAYYFENSGNKFIYGVDIIGNHFENVNYKYPNVSYFVFSSFYSNYDVAFSHPNRDFLTFDNPLVNILNSFFIYDYYEELPIYEITRYEYPIKDVNYNWNYKLMQISKFKPLFNSKDLFVNEEFYKYSNLITYEFKNTDKEKENVVNKYKDDERLKILFDNESITIKGKEYNFHLIKDKRDYISYINFDYSKIDMLDNSVYNAYMYALDTYVNNNNIDDYFIYSKMNFDAKDLLILMSFPIQIVLNTLYNFGVLVGIIVLW